MKKRKGLRITKVRKNQKLVLIEAKTERALKDLMKSVDLEDLCKKTGKEGFDCIINDLKDMGVDIKISNCNSSRNKTGIFKIDTMIGLFL